MSKRKAHSATLKEIARRAGVSHVTVSNVLNGKLKGVRSDARERAERIRKIAEEMGYRPNSFARAMRSDQTQIIGVVVQHHDLAHRVLLGINDGLEEHGYVMALVRLSDVVEKREAASRILAERFVDGLVLVNLFPDYAEAVRRLAPDDMTSVIHVDSNTWADRGCVRRDEVFAGRTALDAVADAGYTRAVYLDKLEPDGSEPWFYCFPQRRESVLAQAEARGIDVTVEGVVRPEDAEAGIPDGMLDRLASGGRAVIACDGYLAQLLANQAALSGKRVGRDLPLACCDDVSAFAWLFPDLARVHFDRYHMGRVAAEMVLDAVGHSDADLPESKLVRGGFRPGPTLPTAG